MYSTLISFDCLSSEHEEIVGDTLPFSSFSFVHFAQHFLSHVLN